jgi:hypothetical protein
MIDRSVDDETGIILVRAEGLWSRAAVDTHYNALRAMIGAIRAAGRPVRILSDVTAAPRQPGQIETHIKWQMERTFRAGDRVAILAGTAADKATLLQQKAMPAIGIFQSRIAAEIWLLAGDSD